MILLLKSDMFISLGVSYFGVLSFDVIIIIVVVVDRFCAHLLTRGIVLHAETNCACQDWEGAEPFKVLFCGRLWESTVEVPYQSTSQFS